MANKFLKSFKGEGSEKPSQSQPLNPIFFQYCLTLVIQMKKFL